MGSLSLWFPWFILAIRLSIFTSFDCLTPGYQYPFPLSAFIESPPSNPQPSHVFDLSNKPIPSVLEGVDLDLVPIVQNCVARSVILTQYCPEL